MKAFLLLAGLGVALISVGGYALYGWYETGQMPLHHGFHRTVSYADDPFSFTYEFGGNVIHCIDGHCRSFWGDPRMGFA